jgi:hypothetical protein
MEVGEAAEQGKSIYSLTNRQVVEAFEKIAEMIIKRAEINS